jgi:hypothetical protein
MIIKQYEPLITGEGADISKVHELPYVTAAAIFSIEDGARYDRLKTLLKDRHVRIGDWDRRVREVERRIKREREDEAQAAAQRAGGANPGAVPKWPDLASQTQQPVNGFILLLDIRNAIQKFIYLKEEQALIVALWVLFTWLFEKVAESNPYLRVLSPKSNCGKSTLLDVLELLTRAAWLISSSTKSNFVRKVQVGRITFLLDEADAFLQENEDFRGVLDAANRPNGRVGLSVKQGDDWVSTDINVFVPIVIASIKKLRRMETVEQRSIHIWLKRATKPERRVLTKARQRTLKATLLPIADRCARWAQDNADKLVGVYPTIDFEDGRDEDKWAPLIGIADYLDADLGKRVRQIAASLIGQSAADDQSLSVRLLTDIKELFDWKQTKKFIDAEKYTSQALCNDLVAMADRPWAAMPAGKSREPKPLSQNRLASILRDFEIEPHVVRIGASTPRGYERTDFEDAWQRYTTNDASEDNENGGDKPATEGGENKGETPADDTYLNSEVPNFAD